MITQGEAIASPVILYSTKSYRRTAAPYGLACFHEIHNTGFDQYCQHLFQMNLNALYRSISRSTNNASKHIRAVL